MVTVEQAKLQFAQQQKNIDAGTQSAIQARAQLEQFRTSESPSVSQLLQRGMPGALIARAQESQARGIKEEGYKSLTAYEKSLGEAQKQLKSQEEIVSSVENRQAEFERGRKMAFSTDPARVFTLTTPESKEGYRYGLAQKEYGEAKIEYQKALKAPAPPSSDVGITPISTFITWKDLPPRNIQESIMQPSSLGRDVITGYQTKTQSIALPIFKNAPPKAAEQPTPTPLQKKLSEQGFPSWITGMEPQKTYTPQELAKMPQYKNTVPGAIWGIFGGINTFAQQTIAPALSKTASYQPQSAFGKAFTELSIVKPSQTAKFIEPQISNIGTAAMFGFFSPLFETAAVKKGGSKQKTETVEGEAKISSKEKLDNIKAAIRENALKSPASNREALIKIYDSGNKEAIKTAENLMKDVLGKNEAKALIADARSQSFGFKPIIPVKPKPVTEADIQAAQESASKLSQYYGRPEYSFTEVQQMSSKVIGATPAQLNLKAIGLVTGFSNLGQTKAISEQQQNRKIIPFISTLTTPTSKTASFQAGKPISISSSALGQVPQLGEISLPQLKQPELTRQAPQQALRSQYKFPEELGRGNAEQLQWWMQAAEEKKRKVFGKPIIPKRSKAFQLFVKSNGRFLALGRPTTRGRAIRAGESFVSKTLSRRFKILPTRFETDLMDIKYQPSRAYREYKISRGRRIPLNDEWIQRARFSLSSAGEKLSIKAARRAKAKRLKIW